MARLALAALLAVGLFAGDADAQQDDAANEWIRVGDAKSTTTGASLTLEDGMVRLSSQVADGVIEFDYRAMDERSEARLWVRRVSQSGGSGYEIDLLPGRSNRAVGNVRSTRASMTVVDRGKAPPIASPEGWRHIVVSLHGDELAVTIDGVSVARAEVLSRRTGFLLVERRAGKGIEIRNLRAVRTPTAGYWPCDRPKPSAPDPSVTMPELLREIIPSYTRRTMDARIQGEVQLSVSLSETGSVRDACVLESLHPDLDASALEAARKWLFKPAMRGGAPVPLVIQIVMVFKML